MFSLLENASCCALQCIGVGKKVILPNFIFLVSCQQTRGKYLLLKYLNHLPLTWSYIATQQMEAQQRACRMVDDMSYIESTQWCHIQKVGFFLLSTLSNPIVPYAVVWRVGARSLRRVTDINQPVAFCNRGFRLCVLCVCSLAFLSRVFSTK